MPLEKVVKLVSSPQLLFMFSASVKKKAYLCMVNVAARKLLHLACNADNVHTHIALILS